MSGCNGQCEQLIENLTRRAEIAEAQVKTWVDESTERFEAAIKELARVSEERDRYKQTLEEWGEA